MKRTVALLLILTVFVLWAKTEYSVILSEKPSITEKMAAAEINEFLGKTAKVAVVSNKAKAEGKQIIISPVDLKMGMEDWRIFAPSADEIILSGGHRGIVYAAWEFLERFAGIMFLDEFTTHIPGTKPVWKKGYSCKNGKSFMWRSVYTYYSGKPGRIPTACRQRQNFFLNEIMHPEKIAYGITPCYGSPRACHSEYDYTRRWPKDVPMTYFALTKKHGKRVRATSPYGPGTLCLSNMDMRKLFLKDLKGFIRQDRKKFAAQGHYPAIYAICYNDNYDPCICDNCSAMVKKLGNMTALSLDFINELARGIQKEFPEVKLYAAAYYYTQTPPPENFKIEKNIILGLAQMGTEFDGNRVKRDSARALTHPNNKGALEEHIQWGKRLPVFTWDYWVLFHGNGLLIENSAAIAENLKIYSKINVVCTFAECGVPLMTSFHPLRLYIGRRFMYDFSLDYKTEVIRFMQAFYGKAYAEMEALRRMIVEENASVEKMSLNCPVRLRSNLNTAFFEKAEKLFETAWKKAGNDKELQLKIRRERLQFDLCRLQLDRIPATLVPGRENVKKRAWEDYLAIEDRYFVAAHRRKSSLDDIRFFINRDMVKYTPHKDFPGRKVGVRYVGSAIKPNRYYDCILEKDAAAENGHAVALTIKEPQHITDTFMIGYYDKFRDKTQSRTFSTHLLKFDGKYNWYKLGKVKLSHQGFAFAQKSWRFQQSLDEFIGVFPKDEVELFFRVKFETVEPGSKKIKKIWFDQIALMLPEKSK